MGRGLAVLQAANAAGLALKAESGRLLGWGRPSEALRAELRACKAEILAVLNQPAYQSAPTASARPTTGQIRSRVHHPLALLPEGADPNSPPPGWIFVREEGPLRGCWVGPGGELQGTEVSH